MLDDDTFAILNVVYLKKLTTSEAVATALDLPADNVREVLEKATSDGLALDMSGSIMLAQAGNEAVLEHYRQIAEKLANLPQLGEFHERFNGLNTRFIKLVSEWQKSDGDERSLERIMKTVERLIKALNDITEVVPRYAHYAKRFTETMTKIDVGERDLVTNPRKDSLHNIWFEFHEDLLATTGTPRVN